MYVFEWFLLILHSEGINFKIKVTNVDNDAYINFYHL